MKSSGALAFTRGEGHDLDSVQPIHDDVPLQVGLESRRGFDRKDPASRTNRGREGNRVAADIRTDINEGASRLEQPQRKLEFERFIHTVNKQIEADWRTDLGNEELVSPSILDYHVTRVTRRPENRACRTHLSARRGRDDSQAPGEREPYIRAKQAPNHTGTPACLGNVGAAGARSAAQNHTSVIE